MNTRASVARQTVAWLCAAVAIAACGPAEPPPPLVPQTTGSLAVEGLSAPVRVVRDRWGVPHIEAQSPSDLFMAQGLVQAQDRLFQMDLWRRSVQGRLAEVLGANFIARDAMTRRMQYRGSLDVEWASYGADASEVAAAFTRGVNAWVRLARERLPEEFVLAGWAPEFWAPEDLLNRTDAFVSGLAGVRDEVLRAQLVAAVGSQAVHRLWPLDGGQAMTVPRGLDPAVVSPIVAAAVGRVGTPPFFTALAARASPDGRTTTHIPLAATGSNAWVAGGSRTRSGQPLLATDPHRLLANPSLRYVVHLKAPGWHVIGATAPWLPGVAIGHNEHIAWSMTAVPADSQDLYVEQTNPENPRQVREGGRFVDMDVATRSLVVKGRAEPFEYDDLRTSRGSVVALDGDRHLAYVVRWSGTEPGAAAELGALALGRATSWDEFRTAAARWKMPAVEFVYADIDGRIGRQASALTPVRRGANGSMPVPAWTGEHDWRGWLPFDERPAALDPRAAYIVSVDDGPARRDRIAGRLAADDQLSLDAFVELQHDTHSGTADRLVALLAGVRGERADVESARRQLLAWNRRVDGSPASAVYVAWERHALRRAASLRVPAALVDDYVPRGRDVLVAALVEPSSAWFDGDIRRSRDELLLGALADAVEAARRDGAGPASLRRVLFAHPLGVTAAARDRFNVGPFPVSGHVDTVFTLDGAVPEGMVGPSFRAIFDLADWDRSLATQAPGQSGSPASGHFADLAELWAASGYFPLLFSAASVEANAVEVLTLLPAKPAN